ncbi:MAG TPA: prepilin-type N-terminal cleavage/methylation domain-containing protein [bacterium]|nr:prepilin-type N-terminal cleavage/methylation domain-containing protein [bacterium]HPO08105.1 prepilin-type N-terminal cleavage/methylation domain-containing protein [bacterium]HQO34859.1 prepilin-type N-terminal cleavage/methylation domain-containing protein [bacterium]HQP99538.1 prepilin-type N-terminal cleavage/methylation domain-containing protein [bacterium]
MIRKAFTLIELLIVVAIIGILAAIAIPNYLNAQTRAKIARVWGDLKALEMALETFALDKGNQYPYTDTVNETEVFPLRQLIHPVAYIPSLPPIDPFRPVDDGTDKPGGTRDYWWNPYWLVTFPEPTKYIQGVGSLRWQLASVGPDRFFDCSPWHPSRHSACWRPYHASNGLVSWGEIYLTGPGGTTSEYVNMSEWGDRAL